MSDVLVTILLIVAIIAIVYYLVKNFTVLDYKRHFGNNCIGSSELFPCHAMDGQTRSWL